MSKDHEWENEKFWIKVEKEGLYPPEKLTKVQSAKKLIKNENLTNKKVLDNGCGTGIIGKIFKEKGARVVGIDISKTLLKEAKKYFPVKQASSYKLPFKNEFFDYVISFMVIHVLDNPEKAIKESCRVLKPNGKLYVGFVHPHAEKWNEKTKSCYSDKKSFDKTEERIWIFNLTDGMHFKKHYIQRPIQFYETIFKKYFKITKKLEPKLPKELTKDKKHAKNEYVFYELTKK